MTVTMDDSDQLDYNCADRPISMSISRRLSLESDSCGLRDKHSIVTEKITFQ